MSRKSSVWLVVLISLVAVAFIATSCAMKQVIKEEAVARPVEAKKEEAKTEVAIEVETPKEEAPSPTEATPVEKPKEEAIVPEIAPPEEELKEEAKEEAKEEEKAPEIAPPEAAFKEETKEEAKEEAKIVPREEVKVYAPKEEVKEEAKEEEKAPEIAPKEEVKIVSKVETQPEKESEPFDLSSLRIQFAFDDYNLSSKAKDNLGKIASWMSENPAVKIQVEGHTCEVGNNEYNLALGERRAKIAKRYLVGLGVSSRRVSTISYGKERPLVPGHTEAARSKNRRDEFVETK
jgi:peptidoglycan-associated lipoprotein